MKNPLQIPGSDESIIHTIEPKDNIQDTFTSAVTNVSFAGAMHPISLGNQEYILKKPKLVEFQDQKDSKLDRKSAKKSRSKKSLNKDLSEETKEFNLYEGFVLPDQEQKVVPDFNKPQKTLLVTRKQDTLKTVQVDPKSYPFDKILKKN